MDLSARQRTTSVLSGNDPEVSRTLNPDSTAPVLLVCDHASNRVPDKLNNLGLDASAMSRHIAYDKGSAELTEKLSSELGYASVLCNFSRLVIDCNRILGDSTLMPEVSDDVLVPGNQALTELQQAMRYDEIYRPYHDSISLVIDRLERQVEAPAVVAIHSFTPMLHAGDERPWHVGVLWDKDPRIASFLLDFLRRDEDLCVGDNQPYSGQEAADYTIDHHGEGRGLPCVSIEIRQDLLSTPEGIDDWVRRLSEFFTSLQKNQGLFTKRH